MTTLRRRAGQLCLAENPVATFAPLVCLGLVACLSASPCLGLTLADHGRPRYRVIVSPRAHPLEKEAARLLQATLSRVVGAEFQRHEGGSASDEAPAIFVGPSLATMTLLRDEVDWASLGEDGIVIKAVGPHLVIAGGRPRGTLNAAYTFLEDQVDCRWWTATEQHFPQQQKIEVDDDLSVVYIPPIARRRIDAPQAFARQLRVHGHGDDPGWRSQGPTLGGADYVRRVADRHGGIEEHPQWYDVTPADESDSTRPGLCLCEPGLRDAVSQAVLEDMGGFKPQKLSLRLGVGSQENRCQSKACARLREQTGSQAGVLLDFANAVAEAVAEPFPDATIVIECSGPAYQAPHGIRAAKNVTVEIRRDPGWPQASRGEPNEIEPDKIEFHSNLRQWVMVARHLHLVEPLLSGRDYLTPQMDFQDLAVRLRQALTYRVEAVRFTGPTNCAAADWIDLRTWVAAHQLWDPSLSTDKLVDRFMNGYYGKAGPYLASFYNHLYGITHVAGETDVSAASLLTLTDLNRLTELFDAAEAIVARDKTYLDRVRRARLSLDRVWLERYAHWCQTAETQNIEFKGPADPHAALTNFINDTNRYGATVFRRGPGGRISDLTDRIREGLSGP